MSVLRCFGELFIGGIFMNTKKAISDYIDSCKNDMINDLRTLAKIPSVAGEPKENMPFGEGPAKALAAALELSQC